jgi:hypothetical protein
MTKSKTKQGMPEICINCEFSDTPDYPKWIMTTEIICTKTNKKHSWEYSCKK